MPLPKIKPVTTKAWEKLKNHHKQLHNKSIKNLFADDKDRAQKMNIRWNDIYFDYSKNRITEETLQYLLELAEETGLKKAIKSYFEGEKINATENRAVLHTALRNTTAEPVYISGKNIMPGITETLDRMKLLSNCVLDGSRKGYTGKPITDIVNIGIGGSDLGPQMVTEALKYYKTRLHTHFVSNVEGDHVHEVIKNLKPETTLFVIVSKTFTTQETLTNAQTIRRWFLQSAPEAAIEKHFVAVSTNISEVVKFGIAEQNIFPMWDWVGGRFSLWSAVGLSICLAVGFENFKQLLAGAHEMDIHFKESPFTDNIPVLIALLSVWYNNFFDAETEVIIPYTQYLQSFAAYFQQGMMESNGKYVDRNGKPVTYQTGTIIWGAPGTNAQHAFFQLMHQGTKLIPADFIAFANSLYPEEDHQQKLMANFFAQTEALLRGKSKEQVYDELRQQGKTEDEIAMLAPYKIFEGDKPSNTFLVKKLTPKNLGKLMAMYEHKIFVQGILWNIYSYDQWGVELGKQLANSILPELETKTTASAHDASTDTLIRVYKEMKS